MGFLFCPSHTSKGILIDSILRDYRSGDIFNCPSWEMGIEELAVAVKWCKMASLLEVKAS